jgi:hypothetical protein
MHQSNRLKLRALACAMLSPLILGGCAILTDVFATMTKAPAETVDVNAVACGAFKIIEPSRRDTDGTLAQIHEHNASWEVLCGQPQE